MALEQGQSKGMFELLAKQNGSKSDIESARGHLKREVEHAKGSECPRFKAND